MEARMNKPAEVIEKNMKAGEEKARLPLGRMILLGVMAGAFIAMGGAASSTVMHGIENVGLSRMAAGAIFPVGLMMIVFVGGELFTGNCLVVLDVIDKRVSLKTPICSLGVVYFSNLIGALIIDVLVFLSGNLDYTEGMLGAFAIKTALAKVSITPVKGIASGILCNIFVCIAILMATAAKDITGKVWAIFFPIMAFVAGGFEHCVANMFYIPIGILAAGNEMYAARALELYGIAQEELQRLTILNSLHNFLPVTLGNMLGGMLFVGVPCYLVYKKKWGAATGRSI
mgnify:FL=1